MLSIAVPATAQECRKAGELTKVGSDQTTGRAHIFDFRPLLPLCGGEDTRQDEYLRLIGSLEAERESKQRLLSEGYLSRLKQLADSEYAPAAYSYGRALMYGMYGLEASHRSAIGYFEIALKSNHKPRRAQLHLADIYAGLEDNSSLLRSLEYYTACAEKGHHPCESALGDIYAGRRLIFRSVVAVDHDKAVQWYEKASRSVVAYYRSENFLRESDIEQRRQAVVISLDESRRLQAEERSAQAVTQCRNAVIDRTVTCHAESIIGSCNPNCKYRWACRNDRAHANARACRPTGLMRALGADSDSFYVCDPEKPGKTYANVEELVANSCRVGQ